MENFDRENIDELLEIRQIRQYFPPSKICAVRYVLSTSIQGATLFKVYQHCVYLQFVLKIPLSSSICALYFAVQVRSTLA